MGDVGLSNTGDRVFTGDDLFTHSHALQNTTTLKVNGFTNP
jgi:hypothetical protein